jgi:N-acetylglucosamine-6-phosphate deacetylase
MMRHGRDGANLLGVHLEGPYINPVRKGAQPEQYVLPPDPQGFLDWVGDLLPFVRIVTLAPEVSGGLELVRMLCSLRIIPSIGHTDATYDEVCMAIDAGARHVTHCCNAMRPLGSREPGVVGAAMTHPELTAELIWDNIHVHPAVCNAIVQAKSPRGVILVSDGIPGAGMPEGYQFSLGDLPAVVKDGAARLPDGTLAGSLLTLNRAFANSAGWYLPASCLMTSYNAACALGLGDRKGLVAPGYDADLTALDAQGNVAAVWVAGQRRL